MSAHDRYLDELRRRGLVRPASELGDPEPRPGGLPFSRPPAPCDYCKGEPVRNAAAWTAPDEPEFAPCPRCGRTHDGG